MRVDPQAVRGILLKANRAHNHFTTLKEAADAWDERRPYRPVVEQANPKGAKYFVRLILDEPIPIEWGVVLGEAVHDLRSALDHAVYWLTVDRKGVELPKTGFPIFTRRNERKGQPGFATVGKRMIRGLGPGPAALIETLQPYPNRSRRTNYSLKVLHEFWNQDKHRLVHLWTVQVLGIEFTPPAIAIPGQEFDVRPSTRAMQHRAVAATINVEPPRPSMEVDARIKGRIALKNPFPRLHGDPNLFTVWDDAANVAMKLVQAIGNQDAPINPDTYVEEFLRPGQEPSVPEAWP